MTLFPAVLSVVRKAVHLGFGFDRDRPGLHGGFITTFQEVFFFLLKGVGLFLRNLKLHGRFNISGDGNSRKF